MLEIINGTISALLTVGGMFEESFNPKLVCLIASEIKRYNSPVE